MQIKGGGGVVPVSDRFKPVGNFDLGPWPLNKWSFFGDLDLGPWSTKTWGSGGGGGPAARDKVPYFAVAVARLAVFSSWQKSNLPLGWWRFKKSFSGEALLGERWDLRSRETFVTCPFRSPPTEHPDRQGPIVVGSKRSPRRCDHVVSESPRLSR